MTKIISIIGVMIIAVTNAVATPNVIDIDVPLVEVVSLASELVPVCSCESSYEGGRNGTPQQFEPDGTTVRWGREHPADKGVCQINTAVHQEGIDKMGLDVLTLEGNIKFANYLYQTQGLVPWESSKSCWNE